MLPHSVRTLPNYKTNAKWPERKHEFTSSKRDGILLLTSLKDTHLVSEMKDKTDITDDMSFDTSHDDNSVLNPALTAVPKTSYY